MRDMNDHLLDEHSELDLDLVSDREIRGSLRLTKADIKFVTYVALGVLIFAAQGALWFWAGWIANG